MAMIPHNALVVVADGGGAVLFRNTGRDGDVSLGEGQRLHPHEEQGPSGHRPPEQTVKQTEEATFAKELGQALFKMHEKGEFKDLVLAADPQTLGQVRAVLHKSVESSLVLTLHKDYTKQSGSEIAAALAKA